MAHDDGSSSLSLFCVVEFVLDCATMLDFRDTALVWPYLILCYLAPIAMIGCTLRLGRRHGVVTPGTRFLFLLVT
jgi:hypothetical protein